MPTPSQASAQKIYKDLSSNDRENYRTFGYRRLGVAFGVSDRIALALNKLLKGFPLRPPLRSSRTSPTGGTRSWKTAGTSSSGRRGTTPGAPSYRRRTSSQCSGPTPRTGTTSRCTSSP